MNRNFLRISLAVTSLLCSLFLQAQKPKIQAKTATPLAMSAHAAKAPAATVSPFLKQSAPAQTVTPIISQQLKQHSSAPIRVANIQGSDVVPGRILIKMKPANFSLIQKRLSQLATNSNATTFNTGIVRLDAIAHQLKATRMVRVFPNAGRMEAKQHKYGLDRWYAMEVDHATEITSAVNSIKAVAEVEVVQPAFKIKSIESPVRKITGATIPKKLTGSGPDYVAPVDDPFYYLQWNYHNTGQVGGYTGADIDLEAAWKINAGTPNVIVDVVDQGADYKHEDLAAHMWVNKAELNGVPGVDDDGNGYVDDIHGYNFADNSSTIEPGDHGTHTSGTIAAVNNNGIGVCGVAGGTGPNDGARIMSSEIFSSANGADGGATAAAIVYGANNGAVISQNSWGYTVPNVYDQAVLDGIDYFVKEAGRDENGVQVGPMNGGVVFFAAGNDNISDPSYPGYYPATVAVGALTVFDDHASYSNYGDWVDISAPGGDNPANTTPATQEIASTTVGSYGYMAGTSMATPHVSGVAALIVSQFGKLGFTNDDLKNRLFHSVRPFIALNPLYNGMMGVGALDAGKALQTDKGIPPTVISDLKGKSNAQNSIDLNWTAPADDDNGSADSYIIYYSKTPFDNTNKDGVTKIIIKKALAAGSPETFTISGLTPTTGYYVGITAKDFWANESNLSNVVNVTTLDGPIVSLPTDTVRMDIDVTSGATKSTSFPLTNNGTGPMNWTGTAVPVSSSWARQNGFNDTLRYVDQDYTYYFIGDDQRMDFAAATRFDVTKKAFNLTHVGTIFQTSGVTAPITIYIYKGGADPSQGTLLLKQVITDPINDYEFTATKLNGMFNFNPGEWFWIVYAYDPLYGFVQGAEYDADPSLENKFMISSDKGKNWQTITSALGPNRFFMYGLSNEGYPGGFISLLPNSGNLSGLNTTTIGVNGNATTVRNGRYLYNLQISSNDLNTPVAGVPMVATVTGQKGTLTSKLGILDCKSVFVGKDGDATIMLYNAGLATLKNFTYTIDNSRFTIVSQIDSLNPGDSVPFTIRFTPTGAGQQLAKIKISTSDGSLNLSGSGVGVRPPVMTLTGVPIQIVAKVDSIGKNSFVISNRTGRYPLSYSMPEIAAINKMKAKAVKTKGTDPSMDYAWIDSQEPDGPVYSWDDISATGTDITSKLAADIKTATLVQLGFNMKYYGDTISQVYVASFGSLTLNYPGAMSTSSSQLPIPNDGINGMIAGLFFEQMNPVVNSNEHVFVKSTPGKFVVQYNDLELFDGAQFGGGSFSLGKATFQIVLYSNGKIEMNFKTVNDTWAAWGYGLTGLESKDETKGINIAAYDTQPTPFVVADNTSVWFVPSAPKFIKSISPTSGAMAVGDSVTITVTASAEGLVDSTYNTSIALTTNDPNQEKLDLPVVFTVTGVQGMMQKTDSLNFGTIYKNGTSKMDAVFLNTGTKPVHLISTTISDAAYTTDIQPVTVPSLSELHIPVTFAPTAEMAYPATMTVTTDDSLKPVFTVVLTGSGKAAPSMSYTLTGGQTNTLNIGETLPASLNVKNNGDGDLKIMVEHPQWLTMNHAGQGVGNGLDSAHTYSIHKSLDSNAAAYDWVELSHGLGTPSVVLPGASESQEIKLPFAFPYYGKNYTSLYMDFYGNVTVLPYPKPFLVEPTVPSPLAPNGVITSANHPLSPAYDYVSQRYLGSMLYYTDADKMIVEFNGMYGGNFLDNGWVTFETIFYKDGRIKMMYQSGETEANFTQEMMNGIENEDGTDGSLAFNKVLWYKNRSAIEYVPSIPYTLKPGESVDLPGNWTTTSLVNGVYKDYISIVSNDPQNSAIHIPLELDVNGTVSAKTSDSVAYGQVVAYTSPDNIQNTYSQPFMIKNNGTQTFTITNIDFSDNNAFVLNEINNYPYVVFPVTLAPGDEFQYHVVFTPIPSMSSVHETINISSDYPTPLTIPITATVIQPPVVTTDSTAVHFNIQQTDSAVKYVQLSNTGNGPLDYTLGIEYHRPGITYSSNKPANPVKATAAKSRVYSLFGGGLKTDVFGNAKSVLDIPAGGFADSILAFENSGRDLVDYLGTGVDEFPITAVSRFNGGKKGFYLSHVGDLYRTDALQPATIKFRIRLGSNINNSTVVYEQSVVVQPDTSKTGSYVIAKLDSSILINAYEDFWIEWEYAPGMRFPQAFQWVSTDKKRMQTYYTSVAGNAFQELNLVADFYMAAYAEKDSTGGWLMITPDKGTVNMGQGQKLTLTAHGPKATPPDQAANLIIHSNDPATPESKVYVFLHIDQPPALTNHDTLKVNEADTLNALIPVQDDNDGAVTVSLVTPDSLVTINKAPDGNYFIYRPGYDDAGLHFFPINMVDQHGNKRTDTLLVLVSNTNRAPIVTSHLSDQTISLHGPALSMKLDTVFTDLDGDAMQYGYVDGNTTMVKVFVDQSNELNVIAQDTGQVNLVFTATDIYGAIGYDTLHLTIKNNTPPTATAIPDVVLSKGDSRVFNLNHYFSDADPTDVLTYSVILDSNGFAKTTITDSVLKITGVFGGSSVVTVTANDGNGGTTSKSFLLTVLNAPPIGSEIQTVIIDKDASRVFDMSKWFSDADSADVLAFSSSLDTTGIAGLDISSSNLTIHGLSAGVCQATITANDASGGSTNKSFVIIVLNDKGNIVDDYHITVGPNPVHSSTTIKFELGTEKKVKIDLISMDGKMLSPLFEGSRSAGYHTIETNLSTIAAGNYLLKFTIDGKEGVVQIAKL